MGAGARAPFQCSADTLAAVSIGTFHDSILDTFGHLMTWSLISVTTGPIAGREHIIAKAALGLCGDLGPVMLCSSGFEAFLRSVVQTVEVQ
jgi:hypothetical protein